jgi:tetratricopeptide (TPR) repeat protein
MLRAVGAAVMRSFQDLSVLPRLVFLIGLAWVATALTFAVVMLLRYQAAFRHEVEEFARDFIKAPWPEVAGWFVLALPLMVWAGAGWAALFWMILVFRFMARSERLATACLLLGGTLIVPVYGLAVGFYGTSADPAVRTTVRSVEGEYDPDRIIRLRQLVEAHPDDPAYHFLLGGLYKNGRYFEEAFDEYKAVLDRDPSFEAAHINIGNIFYSTGQYAAAMTAYRQAAELNGSSFLAYFNLHLAQSEDFHFTEAEESLRRAREIDADRVAQLLVTGVDDRAAVQDASLSLFSVLEAAVGGRSPMATRQAGGGIALMAWGGLINPVAILCALTLIGCLLVAGIGRNVPARRCIRCGRPFCHRCKSSREAQEYCSQCLHLYVLRDGLEPETKARKLYEVRVHESRTRRLRGFLALLFPGSGQLFRGKTGRGLLWLVVWFTLLIAAVPELLSVGADGGLRLSGDLLLPAQVPLRFEGHPGRYLAALVLPLAWFIANWPLRPGKEA